MILDVDNVYLGDCLEKMQLIDDKSIDCIICDLPFGVTACEWDKIIDFKKLWGHYKRITADGVGNLPFRNGAIINFTKDE